MSRQHSPRHREWLNLLKAHKLIYRPAFSCVILVAMHVLTDADMKLAENSLRVLFPESLKVERNAVNQAELLKLHLVVFNQPLLFPLEREFNLTH